VNPLALPDTRFLPKRRFTTREAIIVYLWRVFLVKPLAAVSILVCLVTIFSCFRLERRRPTQKSDRFLIAFLGLLAIYQGMRILEGAGVLSFSVSGKLDDAIELLVAMFYLIAAMLLRFSSVNRLETESAFRLAHAAPPRLGEVTSRELAIPKTSASVDHLAWALPRLSDGGFKLYSYLWMHADAAGRAAVQAAELQLQLKRSLHELETYYAEIERAGATVARREGGWVEFELGQTPAPSSGIAQFSGAIS